MKDILGREIPMHGLVIVKPTGRDSSGLHFGIRVAAGSVLRKTRKDSDHFTVTSYSQYVYIHELDSYHKEIRENLIKLDNTRLCGCETTEAAAKARNKNNIRKFVRFKIYKFTKSRSPATAYPEVYLGECKINGKYFKNGWLDVHKDPNSTGYKLGYCQNCTYAYGEDKKKPSKDICLGDLKFESSVEAYNETIDALNEAKIATFEANRLAYPNNWQYREGRKPYLHDRLTIEIL